MSNIAPFKKTKPVDPDIPEQKAQTASRVRAYAIMGCGEDGFLLGHRGVVIPENMDDESVFPAIVRTAFDGIDNLLWGVVMGPKCVARV